MKVLVLSFKLILQLLQLLQSFVIFLALGGCDGVSPVFEILVEKGPMQITNSQFSVKKRGRRFNPANFKRKLFNIKELKRK